MMKHKLILLIIIVIQLFNDSVFARQDLNLRAVNGWLALLRPRPRAENKKAALLYAAHFVNGKPPAFIIFGLPASHKAALARHLGHALSLPVLNMGILVKATKQRLRAGRIGANDKYGPMVKEYIHRTGVRTDNGVIICDSPKQRDAKERLEMLVRQLGCKISAIIYPSVNIRDAVKRAAREISIGGRRRVTDSDLDLVHADLMRALIRRLLPTLREWGQDYLVVKVAMGGEAKYAAREVLDKLMAAGRISVRERKMDGSRRQDSRKNLLLSQI